MINLTQIITSLAVMGLLILHGNRVSQNIGPTLLLSDVKFNKELTPLILRVKSDSIASGTFIPKGPPINPPIRVEAGNDCIVDLIQTYFVTGTLTGTFNIDYRILVYGHCGEPPGTFNEEWIAHGAFNGKINESPVSGKFSYIAKSKAGGEVDGHIVFNQGITGELEIKGNFNDRKLSYEGWLSK